MRILFTATSFYPAIGGAQLHWYTIANMLAARGHKVTVVTQWTENRNDWLLGTTLFAPDTTEKILAGSVNIHRIAPPQHDRQDMALSVAGYHLLPGIASAALGRKFVRYLRPFVAEADVVHNIRIGRDYFSWASYFAAKEAGIACFTTPNFSQRMMSRYGRVVSRGLFDLLRRCDGVFVFTDEERDILSRLGVPLFTMHVIGAAPLITGEAEPEQFASRFGIDGPMVLFLGQKYEYKGYRHLLEAAPLVWKQYPDTHFVFMGPHYGESENVLTHAAAVDRRIHDLPPDSAGLKSSALARCDLLCLPSRQEGFGGVYTEAWHFAKPVIGCNIPFVRTVVDHGNDGLLVEQNPEEIARAIAFLLGNSGQRARMGGNGRQKVVSKYNWPAITSVVEESLHASAGLHRESAAASRVSHA